MITTEGSPRVHSSCLPDTCSNPYLAREAWGYHGHWGNGEGDAPMGWRWRNQKDQQAGKGMKGGKEPNCTPSPAFLESHQCWVPGTVEPLLTPTSPNLSSTCLAPEASGKFLWEQGSSFCLSWDKSGTWAEHRREGLTCLGPRKGGCCRGGGALPTGPRPLSTFLTLPPQLCNRCVTSFSLNIFLPTLPNP